MRLSDLGKETKCYVVTMSIYVDARDEDEAVEITNSIVDDSSEDVFTDIEGVELEEELI